MKIPITKPFFDENEKKAILEPLESGWVVQGPKVAEFENKIKEFTGAKFAKATSSCTTALHLALIACNVSCGDDVILPSFTYIATANAVEYVKAKPVFVDIDLRTYTIDINQVERLITEKTKAIIPVQLFGLSADMNVVLKLAERYNLRVIEDAACAMGAFYRGKHAGTMGNAGCLSFHPRKSITTGEGGMVLTNNQEIAQKVESIRNHGASVSDLQRHKRAGYLLPEYNILGFNYRMTDFQGAIGVEQIKKLKKILVQKRVLAQRYDEQLEDLEWLMTPYIPPKQIHGYQSYVCLLKPDNFTEKIDLATLSSLHQKRNDLMGRLEEKGIATRQGTHAVHTLGYYKSKYGVRDRDFPKSLIADNLSIALPLYPQMTDTEQEYVIEQIKEIGTRLCLV
ncbi:GDP-perosamine synthase [subsurface metagenome]